MQNDSRNYHCVPHRIHRLAAFTLVELLVMIAIIGILIALLLPAIQSAREAARRTQCQQNQHQLAIANLNYESFNKHFPPGVQQSTFAIAPVYRGSSWLVYVLPALEGGNYVRNWDYADPVNNTLGGETALTAKVISGLLCPSDLLPQNPTVQNGVYYGLTSYGGNGGSRSYFPSSATADGIFHTVGNGAEPSTSQRCVRVREILDGTSKTLLTGERSHIDPHFEEFATLGWATSLSTWGWWGPSGGRKAIGQVTLSAYANINYRIPFSPQSASRATPPATDGVSFGYYVDMRLCAYGSNHPGGANFTLADGSGRFLSETVSRDLLKSMSTRAGNE